MKKKAESGSRNRVVIAPGGRFGGLVSPEGVMFTVDLDDFNRLAAYDWSSNHGYGWCPELGYLHRAIMNPDPGQEVDHIDGNRANCRRANLRIVSHRDNCRAREERKCRGS